MTRGLRTVVATLTGIAAVIVTVLAGLAFWADRWVEDTEGYVEDVAPLAHEPEVQQAVAYLVSEEVLAELDLPALSAQGADELSQRWDLPTEVTDLIDPAAEDVAGAAEEQVVEVIGEVVESEAFPGLWREANRVAHGQILSRLMDPERDGVEISDGQVLLDLNPLVSAVRDQLSARGVPGAGSIQDVDRTVVLVQSDTLATALEQVVWLDRASTWLPWAALGLAAACLLAANRRSAALIGLGIGLALTALAAFAVIAFGVSWLARDSGVADAATAIADQTLAEPRTILLILAGAGGVLAVVGGIAAAVMQAPRTSGYSRTSYG